MSYQSDTQKLKVTKVKEHSSIVDEKLLSERVYYGDQTHVYVGYLRAFKSGYFEGTKIRKITDIAKLLVSVSAMQPCPYFFISLPLLRE